MACRTVLRLMFIQRHSSASLGSRSPTASAPVEILRLMMPTSWAYRGISLSMDSLAFKIGFCSIVRGSFPSPLSCTYCTIQIRGKIGIFLINIVGFPFLRKITGIAAVSFTKRIETAPSRWDGAVSGTKKKENLFERILAFYL